jgi:hypothetical protein
VAVSTALLPPDCPAWQSPHTWAVPKRLKCECSSAGDAAIPAACFAFICRQKDTSFLDPRYIQ